jgi:hypothetical protein
MATYPGISEEVLKYNSAFIDALENVDNVIANVALEQPTLWVNRIKRGTAPLGQGLERSYWQFHSGAVDQSGLIDWRAVAAGNPASEGTPAFDTCSDYPATLVSAGFSKHSYSAVETFRRSEDVCLNNIKWNWEYEQQLGLYFGWLAEVTMRVWENLGREACMKYGKKYVVTAAGMQTVAATYDPLVSKNATCAGGTTPVVLNGAFLQDLAIQLSLERPASAIAMINGQPSWGLVIDPKAFDTQILRETNTREELLYAQPSVLVDGLGTLRTWKEWTLIYNKVLPRWTYSAGTFTRVDPYTSEATTKGVKQVLNPLYLTATHGTMFVFPKDPVNLLIPQENPSNIADLKFGTLPKHNGDFMFLNIQEAIKNPLMEKGHFFGRYQTFIKPGLDVDQMQMYLYKL